MNIMKATVILRNTTDKIFLTTDLPSALPKVTQDNLCVSFEAEYDTGIEYVRKEFNIEPEVISNRQKLKGK